MSETVELEETVITAPKTSSLPRGTEMEGGWILAGFNEKTGMAFSIQAPENAQSTSVKFDESLQILAQLKSDGNDNIRLILKDDLPSIKAVVEQFNNIAKFDMSEEAPNGLYWVDEPYDPDENGQSEWMEAYYPGSPSYSSSTNKENNAMIRFARDEPNVTLEN